MTALQVAADIATEHGIKLDMIRSSCRFSEYVRCRTEIVKRCREMGYSYREIGRAIGKHHKSVFNYARK